MGIRVLYFEDDADDESRYYDWIKRALEATGYSLDHFLVVTTETAARNSLASSEWHLFLVDLWVTKHGKPTNVGIPLIAETREKFLNLAIVGISGDSGGRADAVERGADEYLLKEELSRQKTVHWLAAKLRNVLKGKGVDRLLGTERIGWTDANPRTRAIAEWVGEAAILNLTQDILSRPIGRLEVKVLRPGLSGAIVLGVTAYTSPIGSEAPGMTPLLLKIARDRDLLKKEAEADSGRFPPGLFVKHAGQAIYDYGGWFAIASEFVEGATVVDAMMKGEIEEAEWPRVLTQLFLDGGLKELHRLGRSVSSLSLATQLRQIVSRSREARMREAFVDLFPLASRHDPLGLFSSRVVDNFLDDARFGEINAVNFGEPRQQFFAHGDLHGRNVLLDRRRKPWLIDAGSLEWQVWSGDAGRFFADLLVESMNRGPEAHEWDLMEPWSVAGVAALKAVLHEGGTELNSDLPCMPAYRWLRDSIEQMAPSESEESCRRELSCTIAIEMLRAAYRAGELSVPVRVIAIELACYVFQNLE